MLCVWFGLVYGVRPLGLTIEDLGHRRRLDSHLPAVSKGLGGSSLALALARQLWSGAPGLVTGGCWQQLFPCPSSTGFSR